MKKLATLLAATAVMVYTGCNMYEEGQGIVTSEEKTVVANETKNVAVVIKGASPKSRSALYIEENYVTEARITLISPTGLIVEQYWSWEYPTDTLWFPAEGSGEYELLVEEVDESGNSNFDSHYFEVETGVNYKLYVELGTKIDIIVNDNDTTGGYYETGNLINDLDWYADSNDSGYVEYDVWYGNLMAYFDLSAAGSNGFASIVGFDSTIDFAAHSGLLVEHLASSDFTIALVDSEYNWYEYTVSGGYPDSDTTFEYEYMFVTDTIYFDSFKPAGWTGKDSLDLSTIESIALTTGPGADSLYLEIDGIYFQE